MASSLQTLVKILRLEQQKGYQNKAVIGGFARFSYHWAREAHGQAQTESHHQMVDEIARRLRAYETLEPDQRPAHIEAIIALATGQLQLGEQASPPPPPRPSQPPIIPYTPPEPPLAPETPPKAPAQLEPLDYSAPEETQPAPPPQPQPVVAPRSVRERRGYAYQPEWATHLEDLTALDAPVTALSGIGEKRQEQLARLGVHTIRDLLFFFPRRYDDYSRMKTINQLQLGDEVTVIGFLERIRAVSTRNGKSIVEAYLGDGSGYLRLEWFNQPWLQHQLEEGQPVAARGRVGQYLGRLVINSPEIEPIEEDSLRAGYIVPVYPLTEGLNGRTMRKLVKQAVDAWAKRLPDHLPLAIRERADLMDYGDTIAQLHFPDSWEDKEAAQHRLAFDELFTLHLAMLQRRHAWQSRPGTPLAVDDDWVAAFAAALPYRLTDAQHQAIATIRADMAANTPMNRLLQGDVGSGKTVVATLAAGIAVANGTQVAVMAPTTILAEQHYANFSSILSRSPLGPNVNIALLTGNLSSIERQAIYAGLADGRIQVVIGTHALIQPDLTFAHLGLAVIDEQHRFGVAQRGALRHKAAGGNPHLLVMTATPIPRTLALTLHADLDLTVIDEMPPGRQPVETRVLQAKERQRAYAFIQSQVARGYQAYIIYPLIEDNDQSHAASAIEGYRYLQTAIFPNLRLGLLHGRMRPDEKEAVMDAFYRGQIDILVSTTVIEVGIDVPNATVILIENANRFGLAQLHQLRGRVGRGDHPGYCLLVSDRNFLDTDERLQILVETSDGFALAQKDWELRGAGDLLGIRQSGIQALRFANLMDSRLVQQVQTEAQALYRLDPLLTLPEHQLLAHRVGELSQEGDIS